MIQRSLICLLLLLSTLSIAVAQDAEKMIEIRSKSDFKHAQSDMVAVYGTYTMIDGRKGDHTLPVPDAERLYGVQLKGKSTVMLGAEYAEWNARPEAEITEFLGKEVVVLGIFSRNAPPSPKGQASIKSPCLLKVVGVYDPEIYRLLNGGKLF
jgi:hypothetical protein